MTSGDYGREEFEYDTKKEALEGMERLKNSARELVDGVERQIVYEGKR
jgi:hypothetical protein